VLPASAFAVARVRPVLHRAKNDPTVDRDGGEDDVDPGAVGMEKACSDIDPDILLTLPFAGREGLEIGAGLERQLLADLARTFDGKLRDAHHLRSILLDLHHTLHERARVPSRGGAKALRTITRNRPHILTCRESAGSYMTLDQARRIWDACSLMVQVHGVYFNARILMRPIGRDPVDLQGCQASLGRLMKNLTDRVQDWCGEELHWAYTHSGNRGGALFVIALAVPNDVASRCAVWLAKAMKDDPALQVVYRRSAATTLSDRASYHQHLLRLMCRHVDPGVAVRHRPPTALVDAIGVPKRLRPMAPEASLIPPRVSKTIGVSVRQEWRRAGLPVLTPASDGAWDYDFPGWELHEHRDRQRELLRRRIEHGGVTRVLGLVGGQVSDDPRRRRRSWTAKKPGWWQRS